MNMNLNVNANVMWENIFGFFYREKETQTFLKLTENNGRSSK
jgi:hypothetical protein